jgi:hypothetical protein
LQAIVEQAINAGSSKETIAAMTPQQFHGLGFEMLQAAALTAMYEELTEAKN